MSALIASSPADALCYRCRHRRNVPGDAHSACDNLDARVTADQHGIRNGWFFWPFNFDPVWLTGCSGFVAKTG